jgi:SanA protein
LTYPARRWPRLTRTALAFGAAGIVVIGAANAYIVFSSDGEATADVRDVPHTQVAIVPGAAVRPDGKMSTMLADRVRGALGLWRAGKVDKILVSGDRHAWAFDEPGTMRRSLVNHGVPPQDVFEDHAGFDTWDTMQRARSIFGVRDAVIVTQGFHMPRSLYLAQAAGIDATGLTTDLHPYGFQGAKSDVRETKSDVREILSRVKAIADVSLGTAATGGPPIPITGDGRSSWGPPPPGTPPAAAPGG